MTEDLELLRRYAEEKSEAAFTELVQRRLGLVYAVALRHTRNAQRAEDVAQTVFAIVARKAGELARQPALIGWLYRTTQFTAIDAVRKDLRRTAREQEAHLMHELTAPPPEPDWEKIHPVLDNVLGEMDERDRDAVLLRFFDQQPFAHIGAQLRMTENTARMRVERALEKMRVTLAARGITSTTAVLATAFANQSAFAVPPNALVATTVKSALAPIGAAAGSGGALWQTFASSKTGVGILAAGFAAAVAFSGYEVWAWQRATADLAIAQANQAVVQYRQLELEQRAAVATATAAAARRTAAVAAAASASPRPSNSAANEASLRRTRAEAFDRYGALLPSLQLDATSADHFLNLAGARKSQTDGATSRFPLLTVEQIDAILRPLLGDESFALYLKYDEGLPMRMLAKQLAGAMHRTATPLSDAQAGELLHIFADIKATEPNDAALWTKVLARAEKILTPAQWHTLSGLRDEAVYGEALGSARTASKNR